MRIYIEPRADGENSAHDDCQNRKSPTASPEGARGDAEPEAGKYFCDCFDEVENDA